MMKSCLRALAALLCLLVLVGCKPAGEELVERLEAAEAYAKEGKAEEARLELLGALALDPGRVDVNYKLARLLEQTEQGDDAWFYYEETLRLDPEHHEAAVRLASLLMFDDPERATELIAHVIERDPGFEGARVLSSRLALAEPDIERAESEALLAVELAPESPLVFTNLGIVYRAIVRHRALSDQEVSDAHRQRAVDAFEHAIELAVAADRPDEQVAPWIKLALTYRSWDEHRSQYLDTYVRAIDSLDGHLHLQTDVVRTAIAEAHVVDSELRAWASNQRIELGIGSQGDWNKLARYAAAQGGDADAVIDRMIDAHPKAAWAHRTKSRLLAARPDADAVAIQAELVGALEKVEDPAPLLEELVRLALVLGDESDAKKWIGVLERDHADSENRVAASALYAANQGRSEEAVTLLNEWIQRRPRIQAYQLLAQVHASQRRYSDALRVLGDATRLARDTAPEMLTPILLQLGRMELRSGDPASALRSFRAARARGGQLPPAFLPDLAAAFVAAGNSTSAIRALERAHASEGPVPRIVAPMIPLLAKTDPQRARELLDESLAAHPTSLVLVRAAATLDLVEDRPEQALVRVAAALEAAPTEAGLRLLYAQLLANDGQLEQATAEARRVLADRPGDDAGMALLVRLHGQQGRLEEAVTDLERELARERLGVSGQVTLARVYHALGDDERAIALLDVVVEANPEVAIATNDLAYLLASRGDDLERAQSLAQQARDQAPESGQVADTLGYVYLKRGLLEPALSQFHAAVSLSERGSSAWATAEFHRGLALRELGRKDDALVAIEQALASGADFPEAAEAQQAMREDPS